MATSDHDAHRWYTPAECAAICGCSIDTIRRRLRGGAFPHAVRDGDDPNSPWRIPLRDLEASGLHDPLRTPRESVVETAEPAPTQPHPSELHRQVEEANRLVNHLTQSNQQLMHLLELALRSEGTAA